jgi:hypothetical protein
MRPGVHPVFQDGPRTNPMLLLFSSRQKAATKYTKMILAFFVNFVAAFVFAYDHHCPE